MLDHRTADARPMSTPPKAGAAQLTPAEKVRPRLVAAVVLVAWVTLVSVRRGFGSVMQ